MKFVKNKALLGKFLAAGFFVFVGAVFVFIFWGWSVIQKEEREYAAAQKAYEQKRTAETTGIITGYIERQYVKSYSRSVSYNYTVNDRLYSKSNESPIEGYEAHRKGIEGRVCYDPADPQNALFSLKEENIICGQ